MSSLPAYGAGSAETVQAQAVERAGIVLAEICHAASFLAGWWFYKGSDLRLECRARTRFGIALINEKISLIHSEVSEALEGVRKDKMDDHLPHRKSVEVELADAVIRIFDMAGGLSLDVAGAIAEKLAYNAQRADHKVEHRKADGGEAF